MQLVMRLVASVCLSVCPVRAVTAGNLHTKTLFSRSKSSGQGQGQGHMSKTARLRVLLGL